MRPHPLKPQAMRNAAMVPKLQEVEKLKTLKVT